jgi:peptidoglycan/LPS O-acetylase OafA/YrhL
MVTFGRSFFAFAGFGIVLLFCLIQSELLFKITAPLRYLGTISYGIYLWHLPVLLSLKELEWASKINFALCTLALTILCAALSWSFFEKLFLKKV